MFHPKYSISDEVLTTLLHIEKLTLILNQAFIPNEVFIHIKKQCLVALTHYSTQIEGNQLSMEQVSGVLEKRKTYGMARDEKEVKNYFRLLEKIPSLLHRFKKKVTPKFILECHSHLLEGLVEKSLRGKSRVAQNAIYDSKSGRLVYLPPEAQDVPPLLADLCDWVHKTTTHPILAAAIFHNQFVTIHPFMDGNGRTARLVSLYFLMAKDYDWRKIVPLDRYYADDKGLYYAGLQQNYPHNYYSGRKDTNFTNWIEYYVKGIETVLNGTVNQIDLYKSQNVILNNRQRKILTYLQTHPFVTTTVYSKRFGISTRMATRDLSELVSHEKLGSLGKARATRYFLK